MKFRTLYLLLAAIFALATTQRCLAEDTACRDAAVAYKSIAEDLNSPLKCYTDCIIAAKSDDDYSSEFRGLQRAQKDYEAAILAFRSQCE